MGKDALVVFGGALAGNYVYTQLIVPRGWVEVEEGFGLDDLLHAGTIFAMIWTAKRFL